QRRPQLVGEGDDGGEVSGPGLIGDDGRRLGWQFDGGGLLRRARRGIDSCSRSAPKLKSWA
ncbi:MAG TPA: hypothetical protein PLX06_15640, partial [Fimbriimonadaceae bacterium]|nr:hypothetical protein [Fimbriimonadaceae bacterium]